MTSEFYAQNLSNGHTKMPAKIFTPPDITTPKFGDLVDLALLRVFDAALPLANRPPRLFPTAEMPLGKHFTHNDWVVHGDLETELGRMSYMLSNLSERGIPTGCIPMIRFVLSSPRIFSAWEQKFQSLKSQARKEIQWIVCQTQRQQQLRTSAFRKADFVAVPVDYKIATAGPNYGILLWEAALSEFVTQVYRGHFEQAKTFLQIFSFLKDPLGGLEGVSERTLSIFVHIMASLAGLARQNSGSPLAQPKWHAAAAQAAQEALFLACPLLNNIDFIHFSGHQQLPYVYVPLDRLPRSEFSIPEHVLYIIQELLTSKISQRNGGCAVAPISVSSYPAYPIELGEYTTVIIDGNHRATAIMMLRIIAEYPEILSIGDPIEILNIFCAQHGLGLKWNIDLAEVLDIFRCTPLESLVRDKWNLVKHFRDVEAIPALVVREDHFFTICQQRPPFENRPRFLLPIHQALYNSEHLGFAFPQAGQVHGRAVGFRPMPLLPLKIAKVCRKTGSSN